MCLQVPLGNEALASPLMSAHKRALARVCPHMGLQITRLRELLQARKERTEKFLGLGLRPLGLGISLAYLKTIMSFISGIACALL